MIVIFDARGKPAGMQSLIPANNFVDWDCTENEYYVKETIEYFNVTANATESKEFCMTTVYFYHPWDICDEQAKIKNQLMIQKGKGTYSRNLVRVPMEYEDVQEETIKWSVEKYFMKMGHHVTLKEGRDDCKKIMPVQVLYSKNSNGQCRSSGLVWSHINVNNTGNGWEMVSMRTLGFILKDIPKCLEEAVNKRLVRSMHVWLTPSTGYCGKDNTLLEKSKEWIFSG